MVEISQGAPRSDVAAGALRAAFAASAMQVANGAKRFVQRMQHARMLSTLHQMDAEHLHAIGITRADIPAYAARLVGKDFDRP